MRPIDAYELPKQEIKDEKEYINPSYARGWNDAIRTIYLFAPTIEAEPVRRGRWIDVDYIFSKCDLCGCYVDTLNYATNYCPNCGAKMEEQE